MATGTAPSEATKLSRRRSRVGSVSTRGVRNHVASSKRSQRAFSGPCPSEPQTGWPPRKREAPEAAEQIRAFVEPTSVTVQSDEVASSAAATCDGITDTGVATRTSSASETEPSE